MSGPRASADGRVPSHPVFSAPSQEVGVVADELPPSAWRPFLLREGSKGPQAILCAVLRVVARRDLFPGPDAWLLLPHNPATDELKCYLCHGPAAIAPDRLVWLADRAVLLGRPAALRPGRLRGP